MATLHLGAKVRRLKVLLSAYSCEPGKGSEPGVGWNTAREMAEYHDIWVLTRANNREAIEQELTTRPVPGLRFVYFDLPRWATWWKRRNRGVHLYYLLWQAGVTRLARRLHRAIRFDVAHHITFGQYWTMSFLVHLPVPYVWGPVGGGDTTPRAFLSGLGRAGRVHDCLRELARWVGERSPLVRGLARQSAIALAATPQTALRLEALGCEKVAIVPQVALTAEQANELTAYMDPQPRQSHECRFISIGRALPWKGFHLGLRAFAEANLQDCEYWLLANGPGRAGLAALAISLGIDDRVVFVEKLSNHADVHRLLSESSVLVHPALHEAFGNVVLEAMAVAKPVICLDLGGPALQVTNDTGIKIAAHSPDQVVKDMAIAMRHLARGTTERKRLGEGGLRRAHEQFAWASKGHLMSEFYLEAAGYPRSTNPLLATVRTRSGASTAPEGAQMTSIDPRPGALGPEPPHKNP